MQLVSIYSCNNLQGLTPLIIHIVCGKYNNDTMNGNIIYIGRCKRVSGIYAVPNIQLHWMSYKSAKKSQQIHENKKTFVINLLFK